MPAMRRATDDQVTRRSAAAAATISAVAASATAFVGGAAPRVVASGQVTLGGASLVQTPVAADASVRIKSGLWTSSGFLAGVLGLAAAANGRRRRQWKCGHRHRSRRRDQALLEQAASPKEGVSLHLFSPAKINLFLRIIRKREDGYHDLASLFHTVGFGDTLDLRLLQESAEQDEFECNMPGVPVDETNLVIRAFKLFRERSGIRRFFHANLQKSIPAQAGMGGGSSNAATAFFGANTLCGSPGSPSDLLQWTDDPFIGSDATFFLSEGTAYCTGRGEIVTPIDGLPIADNTPVYLVKPRYGLSTPKVFKAFDINKVSRVEPEELLSTFREHGVAHNTWVNDLERPAFEVSRELAGLKDFLSRDSWAFQAVMMSGSGSTIFCLGDPRGGKEALEAAARQEGFDLELVCRTTFMRRPSQEQWYAAPTSA